MSIGKKIIDKVRQGGFLSFEMTSDPSFLSFLEQIANEQKVSWIDEIEEDTGVWHDGDTALLPEDINDIVKQLLARSSFSDKVKITSKQFADITHKRNIPGIEPRITRVVDNNAIRFYPEIPEFNYIINNILDVSSPNYQLMVEKVLIPYFEFLEKSECSLGKNLPHNVPENVKQGMMLVLKKASKANPIEGLNIEAMAEYTLYNILSLSNSIEMRKVLEDVKNRENGLLPYEKNGFFKNIAKKLGIGKNGKAQKNAIESVFSDVIAKNSNPTKNLECILNGISAQIYMNTIDSKDSITPQNIEDKLQAAFRMYTEHERGDDTFSVDENGYRTIDLGIGGRDILLHKDGDNISNAMQNLCSKIAGTMQLSSQMDEREYIKEVAKIHFRYIMIHPFRDSNGRIGRNIINMMLDEIDRNFVLTKSQKQDYMRVMEEMRQNICDSMGKENYLNSISNNGMEASDVYETFYCEKLADIIEGCNTVKKTQERPSYRSITKDKNKEVSMER